MCFSFLDIVLRVCYACDEDFLVVRNRGEMDGVGWSGYYCIEWNGLGGGSLLNWENECYREMGGLYYWCRVMKCGYYGRGRVI